MFKVIKNGINRLDIEMSGKLGSEEMRIALDELASKSHAIENRRLMCKVIDFHIPSHCAIDIELPCCP